jgi:hypothetical protein
MRREAKRQPREATKKFCWWPLAFGPSLTVGPPAVTRTTSLTASPAFALANRSRRSALNSKHALESEKEGKGREESCRCVWAALPCQRVLCRVEKKQGKCCSFAPSFPFAAAPALSPSLSASASLLRETHGTAKGRRDQQMATDGDRKARHRPPWPRRKDEVDAEEKVSSCSATYIFYLGRY